MELTHFVAVISVPMQPKEEGGKREGETENNLYKVYNTIYSTPPGPPYHLPRWTRMDLEFVNKILTDIF